MKLLFVVSSLDLTQPFSATPAWWQLMKGLYEVGVDVIATPYQGPAIESLWWRAEPNPAQWQGDVFKGVRDGMRKLMPLTPDPSPSGRGEESTSLPKPLSIHGEREPANAVSEISKSHQPDSFSPLPEGEGSGVRAQESPSDLLIRRAAQTAIAP